MRPVIEAETLTSDVPLAVLGLAVTLVVPLERVALVPYTKLVASVVELLCALTVPFNVAVVVVVDVAALVVA